MTLSDLQTLIGALTQDPSHDRYTTSDIGTELDNTQDDWNLKVKIIKDTVTLTTVDGTRQYALTGLTGTPIDFTRVTHKGLELDKRSKAWLDLYVGDDWTDDTGTPTIYVIEGEDPDVQFITVYPIPQAADAGANLVVEYIKRHTSLSASTDVPFMSGTSSNYLLRPYDWYLAYDASARLLMRDASQENVIKAMGADGKSGYKGIAQEGMDKLIEVFKQFEKEEPARMKVFPGRGVVRWHP